MHHHVPRWGAAVFTALVLLLGVTTPTNADVVIVDGDGVVAVTAQPIDLGVVCTDSVTTRGVIIGIARQGGNRNSFKSGTSQTMALTGNTTVGGTASVELTDDQTSVPDNWLQTVPNNTVADDTAAAVVTFTAGSTVGQITGTLQFSASGTNGLDEPVDPARRGTVPVIGTVEQCDDIAPTLHLPESVTAEATGPDGAEVSFTATATDDDPASPEVVCTPPAGSVFPLGATEVVCSASDAGGNVVEGTFTVEVRDTTAPEITPVADVSVAPTGIDGAPVSYQVSAADLVSGPLATTCDTEPGSTFTFGDTTVTCEATDAAGNTATTTFTVTVEPLTLRGFGWPIRNGGVLNKYRAGWFVPVSFGVYAGPTRLTTTDAVSSITQTPIECPSADGWTAGGHGGTGTEAISGSKLAYYRWLGVHIQWWKTPGDRGSCYELTVTAVDGSSLSAPFELV